MTGSPAAAGDEREVAMDALRGIALFGVLMVNLLTEFRVSIFQQFLPESHAGMSALDRGIARALAIGVESKAFILFSFLFGAGLAAQHERLGRRGVPFARYAARRLLFLLALGLVHLYGIWNGDILTLYAVLGTVAALFARAPTWCLALIAAIAFCAMLLPLPPPFPTEAAMRAHVALADQVYSTGSLAAVLAFRVREVSPISALLVWSVPRTLGLFLLGACAWRLRLFHTGTRPGLVRAIAVVGVGLGGAAAIAAELDVSFGAMRDEILAWGPVLLALGYAAAILAAFEWPTAARVLARVAPLGRMALTSYLTQSIVMSAVFYGWGLGLFGKLAETPAAAIGVVLYIAQMILAAAWLRRLRYGPVEWLWRSFTYGGWQPLRR